MAMGSVGERILRKLEVVEALSTHDAPYYRVWQFGHAPQGYRDLSWHGGDEDWVCHVPAGLPEPSWASEGGAFGCCSVSRHELIDGSVVLIGAHA